MAHDHDKHDHSHGHDHGHDHHHHGHDHHHGGHHHHDWHSQQYVSDWIANDVQRASERQPIIERLIAAVPFGREAEIAVLDVGAGAGVVSDAILQALPRAQITLQDYSQLMLARARERLGTRDGRVRYALGDLNDPAWVKNVGGPFELAVSGIAIHNLQAMAAIAACYEGVHGLLKPGGCFLDYDHFDRVGGVPLHQHMLKVAGFKAAEVIWHEHPTAVVKATV